jgi:hypothetical protein
MTAADGTLLVPIPMGMSMNLALVDAAKNEIYVATPARAPVPSPAPGFGSVRGPVALPEHLRLPNNLTATDITILMGATQMFGVAG